jgi:hypothetical protein
MSEHAIIKEFSYGKTKIDFFDPDFDGYISITYINNYKKNILKNENLLK